MRGTVSCLDIQAAEQRCAIVHLPFQSGPLVPGDAHHSVERNAAILPGKHVADVIGLDQTAAGEPAQHPLANLFVDGGDGVRRQCCRGTEAHAFSDTGASATRSNTPGYSIRKRAYGFKLVSSDPVSETVRAVLAARPVPQRGPGRRARQFESLHSISNVTSYCAELTTSVSAS